jgi:hypothetical protein
MLRRIPEAAQSRALDAIAGLEAAGDIEAMVETVLDQDVIDEVKELIAVQATAAVAHMQATIDRLDALLDRLPDVRGYIQDTLDEISAELNGIPDMVDELLDAVFESLDEEDDFDFGPLCDLLGGLPVPVPVPVCS